MLFKDIKMLDENFEVQSHMNVLVKDKEITYIGKQMPTEADGYVDGEIIYDGANKFLVPGFYNMHCHISMTLLRGVGGGLPLQEWLEKAIFPFEAQLTEKDIQAGAALGAMELIASGCTSTCDMYFKTKYYAETLYKAGMKANIAESISCFDPQADLVDLPQWKDQLELEEAVDSGCFGDRIKADVSFHSEYITTEKIVRQMTEHAVKRNAVIQSHNSETIKETIECKQRRGGLTPVGYYESLGVFDNSKVVLGHGVHVSPTDFQILKKYDATIVHNYSSNLKLASGLAAQDKEFRDMGKFTLGTDGASSNNNLNMMDEIYLEGVIPNIVENSANAISAKDVVKMATVNGAHFQDREKCGLIKEGYRADLVVFDLDRPCMQPDNDTLANLVYSASGSEVVLNMVDGDVIYKNGEYTYLDKEKVLFEANKAREETVARM